MPSVIILAACGAGLLVTLFACAYLTPRTWWRRPNLRAIAVLVSGTALLGTAVYAIVADPTGQPPMAQAEAHRDPVAGARYRTHDALNLRAGSSVNAPRLAVVPAGRRVVATGRREGDWWQVRADVDEGQWQGWANSLWLRRTDE